MENTFSNVDLRFRLCQCGQGKVGFALALRFSLLVVEDLVPSTERFELGNCFGLGAVKRRTVGPGWSTVLVDTLSGTRGLGG